MESQRVKRIALLWGIMIAGVIWFYQFLLRPYKYLLEGYNIYVWVLVNHIVPFFLGLGLAMIVERCFFKQKRDL
jgi:hypothetical protein